MLYRVFSDPMEVGLAASEVPRPLSRSQGSLSCGKGGGEVGPWVAQSPAQVPQLGEKDFGEREGTRRRQALERRRKKQQV